MAFRNVSEAVMDKRYLIPDTKQFKANLHCHTVLSDGRMTAEEIKTEYKKRGYAVIAFTDHELIFNHQNLNDDGFIAITAYERALNITPTEERPEYRDRRCYHLNLYAKNPYEDRHVCFDKSLVKWWFEDHAKKKPAYSLDVAKSVGEERVYRYEEVQTIVDTANKEGFLVCINHPYWSLQTHADYFDIKGLFALEVYNTGCGLVSGQAWDDYGMFCEINRSENLAPIAADDNHNARTDKFADSFGGYTMICTDDFSYEGIFSAMERKDIYASTGIDIKELYVKDGVLHGSFSECTDCMAYFGTRKWAWITDLNGLASVQIKIPDGAVFVRVVLHDRRNGKKAATKAFKDFR